MVSLALEDTARKRKQNTIRAPGERAVFTGFLKHGHKLATAVETCIEMLCPLAGAGRATPS
jgi:hypothetical protein